MQRLLKFGANDAVPYLTNVLKYTYRDRAFDCQLPTYTGHSEMGF